MACTDPLKPSIALAGPSPSIPPILSRTALSSVFTPRRIAQRDAIAENGTTLDVIRKNLADKPDDRQSVQQFVDTLNRQVELLRRKVIDKPDDVATRLQLAEVLQQQSLAGQPADLSQRPRSALAAFLEKNSDNVQLLLADPGACHTWWAGRVRPPTTSARVLAKDPENNRSPPTAGQDPARRHPASPLTQVERLRSKPRRAQHEPDRRTKGPHHGDHYPIP